MNCTDVSYMCHLETCVSVQVQFMIGTPPGGGQRRRSASGSSCETPPPVTTWQVSPVSGGKLTPTSSPLRRSGTVRVCILYVKLDLDTVQSCGRKQISRILLFFAAVLFEIRS
jgi:hypothetical protein